MKKSAINSTQTATQSSTVYNTYVLVYAGSESIKFLYFHTRVAHAIVYAGSESIKFLYFHTRVAHAIVDVRFPRSP